MYNVFPSTHTLPHSYLFIMQELSQLGDMQKIHCFQMMWWADQSKWYYVNLIWKRHMKIVCA